MTGIQQSVLKYPLTGMKDGMPPGGPGERTWLDLPRGAQILHADVQWVPEEGDRLFLWALVDTTMPPAAVVTREFLVLSTGIHEDWTVEQPAIHINTIVTRDQLVWHIFEILIEEPDPGERYY